MAVRPRLRRRRRTKIIATLGPASSTPEILARLFQAGADVFRLNFSHGTHEDHAARFAMIRELEEKFDRPIGILADVQGPKLRVGRFSGGRAHLRSGQPFRLDLTATPGDSNRVNLPHPEIIEAATIGATLLVDDGKLRLRVVHKRPDALETEVVFGGPISDHKGVNVPDIVLPIPALTEKDRDDLEFAVTHGANYIGLSFVQRAEDVAEAKELIAGRAWTMVKLEKPQALDNLDAILALTDAVMVARGDLGVELPPEEVPLAQKRIVRLARQLGKPVVVATQMLESMMNAPSPTRAEASDVATAVFDGADAVMLSGETAAGQYPYEAVNMMDRIVARVEQDAGWRTMIDFIPSGIGTFRGRCDSIGRRPRRAYDRRTGHRGVHRLRQHRAASGARTSGLAGDRVDAVDRHRATDGRGVGRARGRRAGSSFHGRSGQPRGAGGSDGRVCLAWGRDRGYRRGAVRAGRHDQRAAGGDGEMISPGCWVARQLAIRYGRVLISHAAARIGWIKIGHGVAGRVPPSQELSGYHEAHLSRKANRSG